MLLYHKYSFFHLPCQTCLEEVRQLCMHKKNINSKDENLINNEDVYKRDVYKQRDVYKMSIMQQY